MNEDRAYLVHILENDLPPLKQAAEAMLQTLDTAAEE